MTGDALFQVVAALAETIREAGEVPAGHLYAGLMGHLPNMTADQFNRLVDSLVRAKLVRRSNHLLTWVGPQLPKSGAGATQG